VALFSDIDWIIIAGVAVFLLLGKESAQLLRTMGRWYARAGRLKQELLGEFTRAADLPLPPSGTTLSIRGALLGLEPSAAQTRGIPAAVHVPPVSPPASPVLPPTPLAPWTGGWPVATWSMTAPIAPNEVEVSR
jgi:hypothetical protein